MDAHDGVDSLDVFGACLWVVAVKVRMCGNVNGFSAVNDLAELWAKL